VSYLLDTHVFLWWITDDPRLSDRVRAVLGGSANRIIFSAVSAWEIVIKARLGRLDIQGGVALLVTDQIAANGFVSLAVEMRHALQVARLPPLHRDPFDRMLIAQAQAEDLTLLTADVLVAQYQVPTLW
jgi:PIN domain nuclease of toxin-antitoxin system